MKQKTSKTTKKQQKLQDDNFIMNLTFDDRMKVYNDNMLNVLGYLEFITPQFSHQITEHDGWFFAQQSRIIAETGSINERTLRRYLNKFVADGLIEYRAGRRTKDGAFSSEFKLNWDYKLLDIYEESTSSKTLSENTQLIGDTLKNSIGDNIGDTLNNALNNNELENALIEDKNCSVPPEYRKQNTEKRKVIGYTTIECMENENTETFDTIKKENDKMKNDLQNLQTFIISFLDVETSEEGKQLYRNAKHQLTSIEPGFISDFMKKVADVKGWETETLNTSNEEAPAYKPVKKHFVDFKLKLQTANDHFLQQVRRYAKEWANLSETERRERYQIVMANGFCGDFTAFETYIPGIVEEKIVYFVNAIQDAAQQYEEQHTSNNTTEYTTTTTKEADTDTIQDDVDTTATDTEITPETTFEMNESLSTQEEYIDRIATNLLGECYYTEVDEVNHSPKGIKKPSDVFKF